MAHLSSSAIFSPSVARQQLAAAKDWNYIDSWLSNKFNGKTPPFERNSDTLKALLSLAALNESADEGRELISRVEVKALQDLLIKETSDPNAQLLNSLESSLSPEGEASLDTLSTLSESTNVPIPDTEKLGRVIIDIQVTLNDLDQSSERISILEKHLKAELELISHVIGEMQSGDYLPAPESAKQTVDYQRKTKILAAKLPELRDRVTSLTASLGGSNITLQEVKGAEEKFKQALATVKDLESRAKNYHGLPQDTNLARLELEAVRVELRDLTRQRDSMFEGLVERESPKKTRS
jgi:HAUS augmin-like complex subunit 1